MAQAARAYRTAALPDRARHDRERQQAPRGISVVRTGGEQAPAQQPLLVTVGKLAAVVLVLVAVLCFARIALTNAAVTTMIESDALASQISTARSSGVGLEMEQSVLSSTSAINSAAKRLHMVAPAEVGAIALDPDVVAVDDAGALSLSQTVRNLVGARG